MFYFPSTYISYVTIISVKKKLRMLKYRNTYIYISYTYSVSVNTKQNNQKNRWNKGNEFLSHRVQSSVFYIWIWCIDSWYARWYTVIYRKFDNTSDPGHAWLNSESARKFKFLVSQLLRPHSLASDATLINQKFISAFLKRVHHKIMKPASINEYVTWIEYRFYKYH